MIKTTNGGASWSLVSTPTSGSGVALRSVCSPDAGQTIWALGAYNWSTATKTGDNSSVGVYSSDHGASWTRLEMVGARAALVAEGPQEHSPGGLGVGCWPAAFPCYHIPPATLHPPNSTAH